MSTGIRAVTDVRLTYGGRRVTAILNRARRAIGQPTLDPELVFHLLKRDSPLL